MKKTSTRSGTPAKPHGEALMVVALAVLTVASLYIADLQTGFTASLGNAPVYGPLQVHSAAETFSQDFKDRLCKRVSKSFGKNPGALSRVNQRIEKRYGFICK